MCTSKVSNHNPTTAVMFRKLRNYIPIYVLMGLITFVRQTLEKNADARGYHFADSAEIRSKMFECSPIVNVEKVRCTTLIALGLKDRRVPPFQGRGFHKRLLYAKQNSRLICYEKEPHAFFQVPTLGNFFMSAVAQFWSLINSTTE